MECIVLARHRQVSRGQRVGVGLCRQDHRTPQGGACRCRNGAGRGGLPGRRGQAGKQPFGNAVPDCEDHRRDAGATVLPQPCHSPGRSPATVLAAVLPQPCHSPGHSFAAGCWNASRPGQGVMSGSDGSVSSSG
jgi:hypothetical protein